MVGQDGCDLAGRGVRPAAGVRGDIAAILAVTDNNCVPPGQDQGHASTSRGRDGTWTRHWGGAEGRGET